MSTDSLQQGSLSTKILPLQLIDIPTMSNAMGDLSFIESEGIVPFEIRRVYFISGIPAHAQRGGHAHKDLFEFIIAVHGALTIQLQDQEGNRHQFRLDSPSKGLLVDSLYWRELSDYDDDSVCLVLASDRYDEEEYLRDFDDFLNYRPPGSQRGPSEPAKEHL
jgi:hypothetical protein